MSVKANALRRRFNVHALQHQNSPRRSLSPIAGILNKLAKHLALIACLMIVGEASGRSLIGEAGIFLIVVVATALHSSAKAIQRRLPVDVSSLKNSP